MESDVFDEDGIVQAKRLITEIESELPVRQGMDGQPIYGDRQTMQILRVLKILTDQLEELRTRD